MEKTGTLNKALRWILFLPVGAVAGSLALFLNYFVLKFQYGEGIFAQYIIPITANFMAGYAFVYISFEICPNKKIGGLIPLILLSGISIVSIVYNIATSDYLRILNNVTLLIAGIIVYLNKI